MHLCGLREADRFADQPFNPCSSRQMLALDLLGVPFPRAVHLRVQMPGVCPPMIGIKAGETKGCQQRFEPQENLVLTTPKAIRQDHPRVVVDRMPQPAWIAFVADKR